MCSIFPLNKLIFILGKKYTIFGSNGPDSYSMFDIYFYSIKKDKWEQLKINYSESVSEYFLTNSLFSV